MGSLRLRRPHLVAGPLLLGGLGCAELAGLGDFQDGIGGAATPTTGSTGTGGASTVGGAAGSATAAGVGGGGAGGGGGFGGSITDCPSGRGPLMVSLVSESGSTYCVDSTEVTQAQYAAFLTDTAGDTSGQRAACQWNTTFAPAIAADCTFDPTGTPLRPISCIDMCDAAAYCEWAGKDLCGRFAAGALTPSQAADPAANQWYRACSAAGATTFPYGDDFIPGACADVTTGLVSNVQSMLVCQGGYPGLFDMSGNVYEWIDACEKETGPDDVCTAAGGSFLNEVSYLECDTWAPPTPRNVTSPAIGVRCCAP